MDKTAQETLTALIDELETLLRILSRDAACPWTEHFATALRRARSLQAEGATREELERLSRLMIGVYGGAGSFGDYAPIRAHQEEGRWTWTTIPGMERFDEIAREVYRLAVDLRQR